MPWLSLDKDPRNRLLPVNLWSRQGRWFYLFHALILLLILYPYMETWGERDRPPLLLGLRAVVILAMIHTARRHPRQLIMAMILALPPLIIPWLNVSEGWNMFALACITLLYVYTILNILNHLFYSEESGAEEIYGTASIYILLGATWAGIFDMVNRMWPGSFVVEPALNIDATINWSDYLYFSFTTLTTLGYGDIVPVTSHARSLSILEALTGVIFIAVMLTRVISLYVAYNIGKKQAPSSSVSD